MSTLIINTPSGQVQPSKQSFEETLKRCVGVGFAMGKETHTKAQRCKKVIILDKDAKQKAVSVFLSIEKSALPSTLSGLTRYDVNFEKPLKCQYRPERLNRNGIGIKDGITIIVP